MKKIVFTGPESTGKTTIATSIADQHHLPLVSEYARVYLNNISRSYEYADLELIAKGQLDKEKKASTLGKIIICDTDLLTIKIWAAEVYAKASLFIEKSLSDNLPSHYFLCSPDIPWEPDSMRENPQDRDRLFTIYEREIRNLRIDYTVLAGSIQERENIVNTKLLNLLNQ